MCLGDDGKTGHYSWNGGYDKVRELYQLRYRSSNWNMKEWIYGEILRLNPNSSTWKEYKWDDEQHI